MALNDISLSISGDPSGAVNALRQTESAARQTGSALGRMASDMESSGGRMASSFQTMLTAAKGLAAAFGVGMGISAFITQLREAITAIDSLKIATIQIASQITTMQGPKNVAEHYRQATVYANALAIKLQEVDAKSFANYDTLLKMVSTMAMQGVLIDINNKKQVEAFTSLSNAVAMYTAGQNQSIQAHQEIRALMSGEVRQGAQLAIQVDELSKASGLYKNGLKDIVEEGKKHGDTLERLAPFLAGINAASSDIATTWTAVSSSMETALAAIRRAGFDSIFQEAVKQGGELVGILKDQADIIGNRIHQGWLAVRGVMESVTSLVLAFKEPLGILGELTSTIVRGWGLLATAVLPPLIDRFSELVKSVWESVKMTGNLINMGAKAAIGDWAGATEAWNSAKENFKQGGVLVGKAFKSGFSDEIVSRTNEFMALDVVSKNAMGKVAIPVIPKSKDSTDGETDLEAQARYNKQLLDAEAALKQQYMESDKRREESALKDKLARLSYEKDMGILSVQQYLDQKYELETAAYEQELAAAKEQAHQRYLAYSAVSDDPGADRLMQVKAEQEWAKSLDVAAKAQDRLSAVTNQYPRDKELAGIKETANELEVLNKEWARQLEIKKELQDLQSANSATSASLVGTNESGGFDSISDQVANQLSVQQDAHEKRMAMIEREKKASLSALEANKISYEEYTDKTSALNDSAELERRKNAQATTKIHQDSYKSQLSMVANYAGIAGDLFSQLAESQDQSSRDGFEAAKKYATAAAIMNTAAAIMNAMATSSNIYVGIAMAALAAATGAIQIAKIQSTTFGGGDTSVTAPSGTVSGAGTSSGGVAGSAIGTRYVSIQDSQTTEALQSLADSADNASLAIGKIVDGFSKIASLFSDGGYASMYLGNSYGMNNLVKASASPYTAQNMSLFTSGTGLVANLLFGLGNQFAYKGSALMLGGTAQGVAAADVDEYRKAGGLFGGGKTRYDIKYDSAFSEFAQGLVTTITTSINRMAITLGTSANIGNIAIPGTAIQTTGRTAEQISADVQKWLQNVAATLAGTIPELEKFAFAGENYYLALTRLNDALVSTNQRLQEIGATLITSTLEGANAAYKLQDLMGGSEAFSDAMDTYFTSIFTDAEQKAAKLATAQRQVNNAFAEMGATGITTRAQFKALVNGLDLTTEFGARTFAALMEVSEAFGTVTEEAEKAAQALLTTLADTALAAAEALKDIMGGPLSTKSPGQIYEEQRKAFADALAAGRTAELPELGKALLEASRNYNASGAGYVSDYQMVTDALMNLAGLSGTPTIDKVQAQINILTDIRDNLETQNQAQLAALSGMLGTTSPLYVALKSYLQQAVTASTTTDSVLNAMKIADLNKQLSTAQAGVTAAQTTKATATSDLESYISGEAWLIANGWAQSVVQVGENNKRSALATAAQQLQAAMDVVAGIQAQLAALQTIPGHAIGGLASGWSWVGERGPELVNFTNTARVYTAEQSRGMVSGGQADNSDVVAELKSLREEVRAVVRVSQAGYSTLIEQGEVSNNNTGEIAGKIRFAEAA